MLCTWQYEKKSIDDDDLNRVVYCMVMGPGQSYEWDHLLVTAGMWFSGWNHTYHQSHIHSQRKQSSVDESGVFTGLGKATEQGIFNIFVVLINAITYKQYKCELPSCQPLLQKAHRQPAHLRPRVSLSVWNQLSHSKLLVLSCNCPLHLANYILKGVGNTTFAAYV